MWNCGYANDELRTHTMYIELKHGKASTWNKCIDGDVEQNKSRRRGNHPFPSIQHTHTHSRLIQTHIVQKAECFFMWFQLSQLFMPCIYNCASVHALRYWIFGTLKILTATNVYTKERIIITSKAAATTLYTGASEMLHCWLAEILLFRRK